MRQPAKNRDKFLVLQNGQPMVLADTESDKKIWALFFADKHPTLFDSYDDAYNAIRRQKRMEKKSNETSLGRMSTMRVAL